MTNRVCDHCGRTPGLSADGLLGTWGGSNEPWDYLCISCWRRYEETQLAGVAGQ